MFLFFFANSAETKKVDKWFIDFAVSQELSEDWRVFFTLQELSNHLRKDSYSGIYYIQSPHFALILSGWFQMDFAFFAPLFSVDERSSCCNLSVFKRNTEATILEKIQAQFPFLFRMCRRSWCYRCDTDNSLRCHQNQTANSRSILKVKKPFT